MIQEQKELIYQISQKIFPQAKRLVKSYLPRVDETDLAQELLNQAVITVLKKLEDREISLEETTVHGVQVISNPSGYLLKIFENNVKNYYKKKKEEAFDEENHQLSDQGFQVSQLEKEILIREIIKLMKPEERFIFQCRQLDYNFDEIAIEFNRRFATNVTPAGLRVKFQRIIKKLARQLLFET